MAWRASLYVYVRVRVCVFVAVLCKVAKQEIKLDADRGPRIISNTNNHIFRYGCLSVLFAGARRMRVAFSAHHPID